jgi:hypothetical protein
MLKQSIELAKAPDYPKTLARTADALTALRKHHADGTLPLLRLPEKRDDVSPILGYARLLQENTTDVVWLGTGGSSLGGQTLAQLAGHAVPALGALRKPRLHFLDNLPPKLPGDRSRPDDVPARMAVTAVGPQAAAHTEKPASRMQPSAGPEPVDLQRGSYRWPADWGSIAPYSTRMGGGEPAAADHGRRSAAAGVRARGLRAVRLAVHRRRRGREAGARRRRPVGGLHPVFSGAARREENFHRRRPISAMGR